MVERNIDISSLEPRVGANRRGLFSPGRAARVIRLQAPGHVGAVRFVSALNVQLEEGRPTRWQTVTRTGAFSDPRYGSFSIFREMLLAMVDNFKRRTYGQDIFIDVAHRPDNGAAGKIVDLAVEGDRLRALVEWTDYGVEAIKAKGYQYLSAEYHENWGDNEKGEKHGPVLLGAGLTIRPVIKGLDPVTLSDDDDADRPPTLLHPTLAIKLSEDVRTMWKELIKRLREQLATFKLSEAVIESLSSAAEKALGPVTDKPAAEALVAAMEQSGKQLAEQLGSATPAAPINVTVTAPSAAAGVSADDVRKILAEQAAANAAIAKAQADQLAAKRKLLADTINAATGLDETLRRELTESVIDLVTPELTDEQVKKFAESQIDSGNRVVAARSLASMGFVRVQGSPHIEVSATNEIKSLQETIDKRLGFAGQSDAQRYKATGGALTPENKALAEMVLAEFDRTEGRRLMAEHKQLAAGDSVVSDVAIPAIFERTVIRESLYQLIGTQFVNVGTLPFSAVAQIPYSFRDTSAAGVSSVRKYEGQAIPRAAVKQLLEEARPIPQKLAFEVSDELRYLTSNGQLDWDAVGENTRNAGRVIGEDTEALIFNEVLNASDQFAVTAVSNEATGTGNGTNRIFPLDNFPVVRPKVVRDLQGTQVGSTLYPITVTVNAVSRPEYDGTNTQAAGIYWTMNYNLGELNFVTELGAPTAVPNTQAIVCSYSYTTNVQKWDSDLGTLTVDAKYDDFLYRFGLRKAVVENDRYYSTDFGLMSGTVRAQIEQARQFAANFARSGTGLQADGNLGQIKGLPQFRTTAPGLYMGDQRVVIGVRGTTRWRMMKPWAMGEMENQKDANGRFTGKKEAYGDQFVVCMTPAQLKGSYTSMVLYSAAARVDRVS